ncbi:fibronectin type III domain-containing protein [Halocola ammonii]
MCPLNNFPKFKLLVVILLLSLGRSENANAQGTGLTGSVELNQSGMLISNSCDSLGLPQNMINNYNANNNCWFSYAGGSPDMGPDSLSPGGWDTNVNFGGQSSALDIELNNEEGVNRWIMSPTVLLPSLPSQLLLDMRIFRDDPQNPTILGIEGDLGVDDEVHFLITNDNGQTFTSLLTWNSDSTFYEEWSHYLIHLTNYSGELVQFAFWATDGDAVEDTVQNRVFFKDFIIRESPECPNPSGLSVSEITNSTAEISWEQSDSATVHILNFGLEGFDPDGQEGSTISAEVGALTLNDLMPATNYQVYVRANCEDTLQTDWVGPLSFGTHCDNDYGEVIWCEGFESGVPGSLQEVLVNGNSSLIDYEGVVDFNEFPFDGSRSALFKRGYTYGDDDPDTTLLISPSFNGNSSNGLELSLSFVQPTRLYLGDYNQTIIEISNDDGQNWVLVDSLSGPEEYWTSLNYFLNDYIAPTESMKVRFVAIASNAYGPPKTGFDNIIVMGTDCEASSELSLSTPLFSSVELNLISPFNWQNFNLKYAEGDFDPYSEEGQLISEIEGSYYNLNGLTPNSQYSLYYSVSCNAGDDPIWLGPYNFQTECMPYQVPFFENFQDGLPSCWDEGHNGSLEEGPMDLFPASWGQFFLEDTPLDTPMVNRPHYGLPEDDWLISPIIELPDEATVISFDLAVTSDSDNEPTQMESDDTLQVVLLDIVQDQWTVLEVFDDSYTSPSDGETITLYPSGFSGNSVRIGFRLTSAIGGDDYFISVDNVSVEEFTGCLPVEQLQILTLEDSTATVQWSSMGDESQWILQYGESGFNPELNEGVLIGPIDSTSYELTDLTHETEYEVYIKPFCNDGVANWINSLIFETLETCPAPQFMTIDRYSFHDAEVSWSPGGIESQWEVAIYSSDAGDSMELVSDSTHVFNELEPSTEYEVRLRAVCEVEEDFSDWTDLEDFTTYCSPITPEYLEFFEENDLECWRRFRSGTASTGPRELENENSSWVTGNDDGAKVDLSFGSDEPSWLVSNYLDLSGPDQQLAFNLRVFENDSGNPTALPPGAELLLMITDDYGETWETLNSWDSTYTSSQDGELFLENLSYYQYDDVQFAFRVNHTLQDQSVSIKIDYFWVRYEFWCGEPEYLETYDVSFNSSMLGWYSSDFSNEWEVVYGEPGFDPDLNQEPQQVEGNTSILLTDLEPNTTYEAYVKSYCEQNFAYSEWSSPESFRTLCEPVIPNYIETFDEFPYGCWREGVDQFEGDPYSDFEFWEPAGFGNITEEGAISMVMSDDIGLEDYLISPPIDLSDGEYQLDFDMIFSSYGQSDEPVSLIGDQIVRLKILSDDSPNWQTLETWDSGSNLSIYGEMVVVNLAEYSDQVIVLALDARDGPEYEGLSIREVHIDNFRVRSVPSCPEPTSFNLEELSPSSVELSWGNSNQSVWQIRFDEEGFDPTIGDGELVTAFDGNSIVIEGLQDEMTFDFYIRSQCDTEDGLSEWIGPITYTTPCNPGPIDALPWFESFEVFNDSESLPCGWTRENPEFSSPRWEVDMFTYFTPPNSLKLSNVSTEAEDGDWAFTPSFYLQDGVVYALDFESHVASQFQNLSVYIGTSADMDGMEDEIVQINGSPGTDWEHNSILFQVAESGEYNFGFLGFDQDGGSMYRIDDVVLRTCDQDASFFYPETVLCTIDEPMSPVISGDEGGMFQAEEGLAIDSITGLVTPGSSLPGQYVVSYTILDPLACNSTAVDDYEIFIVECVGVEENQLPTSASVYPNPAKNLINIQFPEGNYSNSIVVELIDSKGAIILKKNTQQMEQVKLDISGIEPGLYLIRIITSESLIVRRVVIE